MSRVKKKMSKSILTIHKAIAKSNREEEKRKKDKKNV